MANEVFYPAISSLVSVDALPDQLGFLKGSINNVLNKIYFRDFQFTTNARGDAAFYSLTIVTKEVIAFEIPGTGIDLVLNPAANPLNTTSEFPVTLAWEWPILGYINNFKAQDFSFEPNAIFDLVLQVLGISERELVEEALNAFLPGDIASSVPALVQAINSHPDYSTGVSTPAGADPIGELLDNIENQLGVNPSIVIFAVLILDSNSNTTKEKINKLFHRLTDGSIIDQLKKILIPKIDATLKLSVALEFSRNILVPLDAPGGQPLAEPAKSRLTFAEAPFRFSTESGIGYDVELAATLTPSWIGKTGLELSFTNAKLDLSQTKNIRETDLDGRPENFMGVYVQNISVTLPKKWFNDVDETTARISGSNILIGTGGISGTIALEALGGDNTLWAKIGDWRLGFNKFDITFRQNAVTSSNIKASLEIPKFKSPSNPNAPLMVDLTGHLNEEGDFSLTASVAGGIKANLFNFVNINFLTLELGREDDDFFIGTSCEVWFENPVMQKIFKDQKIVLPRVRLYDNGRMEIVGGNAFIPVNISLQLGPVEVAVTGIHFGSHQQMYQGNMRKYNYWGFDGAISIDPLGIDARGEGIKYYYTADNDEFGGSGDSFLRIQTIEVDLIIPGTASPATALAIIHGMVSIPEPGESPEYMGEVSLKLPKAKISGGAAMRLQPKHPAFIVDAFVDLPAPIPVGPVGIYGFRGLIGFRYVAEKEAVGLVSGVDSWYDYYTYPPKGIHISKFSGPERTKDYSFPMSIGAGAVLGTSFDSGTVLSIRAMLLLSLPTLFMIEGRATILSARLGLTDDKEPPFFAFIAWGDNSLELGIGADFKMPSSNGWILELYAEVQAGFFFNNPSNWYVNFGTKQQPITARVLTLLTAKSYLMLSARGIEAGARVDFELNKRFGPAKVHIYAYVEVGGQISFERPQIGGYLAMGGMIDIEIWIVGVSIGLDAILSVEAAKPFLLFAELRIRVCIRIIKKICKSFTVQLRWEKDPSVDRTPVPVLSYSTANGRMDRTRELVQGVHMLTNETFELDFLGVNAASISQSSITRVIPLDTFIDLKTEKGLVPTAVTAKVGGHTGGAENFTDLIPPVKVVRGGREVRQVKHKYSIEDIEIRAWTGTTWAVYHPYQAIVEGEDVTHLRVGYWQRSGNHYDTIRLLANNPFAYTQAGEPGWFIPEQYGITPSELFCSGEQETHHCSNVLNKAVGTIYYPPQQYNAHFINGAYYTLISGLDYDVSNEGIAGLDGDFMKVTDDPNPFGFATSLSFNNYNSMVITLPEPSVSTKLRFTTNAAGANIKYYRTLINDNVINPQYQLIHQVFKTSGELMVEVVYENAATPITRIVIEPRTPNSAAIEAVTAQIESLFSQTYDNVTGEVFITEPQDTALYHTLLKRLAALRSEGCASQSKYYFANYYGFNQSFVRNISYSFFERLNDTYLLVGDVLSVDDDFGSSRSIIVQLDGKGNIIRQKTTDGVVSAMEVIGGHVYLEVNKRYSISIDLERPQIIKLDASLNQVSGVRIDQPVPIFSYNEICPIAGTPYFFWITSSENGATPGTRISLCNTSQLQTHDILVLNNTFIKKARRRSDRTWILLTTRNEVIDLTLTADDRISIGECFLTREVTIHDLMVVNGRVLITGTYNNSLHFVGVLNFPEIELFIHPYFSPDVPSFSNFTVRAGQLLVHNAKNVLVVYFQENAGVFNMTMEDARRIVKPAHLPGPDIKIYKIENDPVAKEVYMICGENGYYHGGIAAVFGEDLNTCMLTNLDVIRDFERMKVKLVRVDFSFFNTIPSYQALPSIVNLNELINVVNIMCPPVQQPGTTVRCITALQQVCWLTLEQFEYNQTIPGQAAVEQDQEDMVEALQKTAQPIWRPNTRYYIRFRLKDEVDNGSSSPGVHDYYYGFRTVGPVGHYHKHPQANYVPANANPDQYPLTSLRQYIDYNRSYPNADGNLLQAKPVFYGHQQCKITVFFAQPLAYHMLTKWPAYNGLQELKGEMHIAIKDPVTDTVIPYPLPVGYNQEPVPAAGNAWTSDNDPRIPLNIRILNNYINHVNANNGAIQCQLTIGDPIAPAAYAYSVTLTNLKPQKLYTAILYNAFDVDSNNVLKSEEVHQYVFQTSRYATFEEQVESYILDDGAGNQKQAVFTIDVQLASAAVNTLWNMVAGIPDAASTALETRYQHLFDRATEGLMDFPPLEAAVTTEFNLLKNDNGDVIAILIRNPEPFNIPRIPLAEVQETIAVLDQGGNEDSAYKVLFSKDYSQALIMHSSKKITAQSLDFRFKYKTWNGTEYVTDSTIDVLQIQVNA